MFYALSKMLDLAFSPLWWALVLALSAGLLTLRRRARAAWITAGLSVAVLYVSSTGLCAAQLARYAERFDGERAAPDAHYDAVVLLGGFIWRNEQGAIELTEASDRGLRAWDLLRTGRADRVIIAAGGDDPDHAEADVAADFLAELGIARERMLLDRKSRNTRENALEVRKLARAHGLTRLVVVTSAFHMQRALGCMHAVGLAPDAFPTDHLVPNLRGAFDALTPRASWLGHTERVLRELAGRLVYRLRGYAI